MWLFARFFGKAVKTRQRRNSNCVARKQTGARSCRLERLENRQLLSSEWIGGSASPGTPWNVQSSWNDNDIPWLYSRVLFDRSTSNDYANAVGGPINSLTVQKTNPANNVVYLNQTSLLNVTNSFSVYTGNLSTNGSITVGGNTTIFARSVRDASICGYRDSQQ